MPLTLTETSPEGRSAMFKGTMRASFEGAAKHGSTHVLEIAVAHKGCGAEISEPFKLAFIPIESEAHAGEAGKRYKAAHVAGNSFAYAVGTHPIESFCKVPEKSSLASKIKSILSFR